MNLSNQHSILLHSNKRTCPKKKGKYFFLKYIIIAALIFMIISYFHVGGGEISGIKNISTKDTVYAQLYDDSYQLIDEKKLNSSQIEAIKLPILRSNSNLYWT